MAKIVEMEKNKHQFFTTSKAGLAFYRGNNHSNRVKPS
jgi:hypothetical protein